METKPSASIVMGSIEDLPSIYQQMERQFPPTELYGYKNTVHLLQLQNYRIVLYRRNSDHALLGYALVFVSTESSMLWLDYIAVLPEFQGQGLGGAFFTALCQKYCGPFDGLLFSVEHVCDDNEALAARQRARLAFYKRMGAFPLKADFILPHNDGQLPMYLFFKPRAGLNHISRITQIHTLSEMYDYCFFYMKNRKEFLPCFKQTIQDEFFCGQ